MLGGGDRRLPRGGFQESGDRPESPPILHTPPRMRREEPAEHGNPAKTEEAELSGRVPIIPPRHGSGGAKMRKPRRGEPWRGRCKRLAAPLRGGVYRFFRGGVDRRISDAIPAHIISRNPRIQWGFARLTDAKAMQKRVHKTKHTPPRRAWRGVYRRIESVFTTFRNRLRSASFPV